MKNLETIPVISCPRTQDCNIQKTASIQLVLRYIDSRLIYTKFVTYNEQAWPHISLLDIITH